MQVSSPWSIKSVSTRGQWAQDAAGLITGINEVPAGVDTTLYNGAETGTVETRDFTGRSAVIVLPAGKGSSSPIPIDGATNAAQSADVPMYTMV